MTNHDQPTSGPADNEANRASETPRTDAVHFDATPESEDLEEIMTVVDVEHARQLERELAAMTKERNELTAVQERRMLESKMIEHILDDEPGWKSAIHGEQRCPTMQSAIELRLSFENSRRQVAELEQKLKRAFQTIDELNEAAIENGDI